MTEGLKAFKLPPMRTATALAVLIAMSSATRLGAQLPPAVNQQGMENAAVKYLRADASLRQSYALAPDAAAKLEKVLKLPLDGEDEKLVAAAEDALVEFQHGAAIERCDWAMSAEDGPLANTAHRGAIMELVNVSGLRARLRFRDGDTPGAMRDVLAAMAAARHLSVDGSLASVLFAYKLENSIAAVLAQNLLRFSPAQLNELARGLNALPSGSSLGTAFESEKVSRNDLLPIVKGAKSRDELIEQLLNKVPALQSNRGLANEIVDGCGGTVKGIVSCIDQQQAFYKLWAPRFTLPPEQFQKAYKAEIEEPSRTNPVIRVFTPTLPHFRWAEAYSQTRRALLHAAIAVRLEGLSSLNQHLDPYDRRPFSYIPVDGGFRLESRLSDGGIPISLSILPGPEKPEPSPR
jgi:hypothetical protein